MTSLPFFTLDSPDDAAFLDAILARTSQPDPMDTLFDDLDIDEDFTHTAFPHMAYQHSQQLYFPLQQQQFFAPPPGFPNPGFGYFAPEPQPPHAPQQFEFPAQTAPPSVSARTASTTISDEVRTTSSASSAHRARSHAEAKRPASTRKRATVPTGPRGKPATEEDNLIPKALLRRSGPAFNAFVATFELPAPILAKVNEARTRKVRNSSSANGEIIYQLCPAA